MLSSTSSSSWTPLYADGVVYVGGMRDVLAAIDVENGETLWRKDFVEELDTSLPDFGFVSSPMLVDGEICVQAGGSFVKIDGKSGEILWRSLVDGGGTMGSAFSSPVRATIGGRFHTGWSSSCGRADAQRVPGKA